MSVKLSRILFLVLALITAATVAFTPVAHADGGEDPPVQTDVNWNS